MKYFEDLPIGYAREQGSHVFTADEIIAFARRWDPQRFHLSEEGARDSQFGRLCASGWHTVCAWMRLNIDDLDRRIAEARAAGEPVPRVGPSPGLDDLKWPRPVFAEDRVAYRNTIVGKIDLPRRPEWGLVNFLIEGTNQGGEPVLVFTGAFLLERRQPLGRPAA